MNDSTEISTFAISVHDYKPTTDIPTFEVKQQTGFLLGKVIISISLLELNFCVYYVSNLNSP